MTLGAEDENEKVDTGVDDQEISAEARLHRENENFDAHGGDDESLMVVQTDAEHERSPVEVFPLLRRVDPTQEEDQDEDEREYAEGVNLDDDGLAPHEAVVAEKHSSDEACDEIDPVFIFGFDVLKGADALHEHAAASSN